MERKGSTTVAVTAEEIKAALPRARTLSSEEEKALRMRHGAGAADLRAPLPRAAGGNVELNDELMLMELQLMRAFKARAAGKLPAPPTRTHAVRNLAKDKIVRALRKKK